MATKTHRNHRGKPLPNTRQAGVLLLLYPGQDDILCFPLIRRPRYEGAHSGQIAFPGGKIEPEDTSIIATALRETKEEIGVEVETGQVLGRLSDLYIPVSRFVVSPVVAHVEAPPVYQTDPFEVESTLDVLAQDFLAPENIAEQVINVRGVTLRAPTYRIQENTIWGATAMMLAEFFAVLSEVA